MGKLYERMLLHRLRTHIDDNGGLSPKWYGFQKGRSTVDAIRNVTDIATKVKNGTWKTKGFCLLITLDISNAFNMVRWDKNYGVP